VKTTRRDSAREAAFSRVDSVKLIAILGAHYHTQSGPNRVVRSEDREEELDIQTVSSL